MENNGAVVPGSYAVLHRGMENPGSPRWIHYEYTTMADGVKWR